MKLQFRSNAVNIESRAQGYFFRRSLLGSLGKPGTSKPPDVFYYLVGILRNGMIYVQKWRTPELILNTEILDIRDPEDKHMVGNCLIKKPV